MDKLRNGKQPKKEHSVFAIVCLKHLEVEGIEYKDMREEKGEKKKK